mmetsp:Transcript_127387/g.271581  ORF Transcript_127387/g.271581 Transcript_127387/m.271581 type:complete len:153 (+) Transcript_127387:51-509(+)
MSAACAAPLLLLLVADWCLQSALAATPNIEVTPSTWSVRYPNYDWWCDKWVEECAHDDCDPVVFIDDPQPQVCDSWKCLVFCANSAPWDCLAPWQDLCEDAKLDPQLLAEGCNVTCSAAIGRHPLHFTTRATVLAGVVLSVALAAFAPQSMH